MYNNTQANKLAYTLGIDIGISSIGWSVIQLKQDSDNDLVPGRLIDCGVRVFLNQADDAGLSPAEVRRNARSARRRLRRRKGRLLKLQSVLKEYGIERPTEFKPFYYTKPDGSPYGLRLKALEELLTDGELYQVLHNLIKFRGFKSNRKEEAKQSEQKDLTKYYKQIEENRKNLQNYRTVGEMLVLDPKYQERKRNSEGFNLSLFKREDIRKEIETILDYQIKLGNSKVNETLKQRVLEIFDYQKPFASKELIEKTIGFCTFYKNEHRASKFSPYNQERIIWEKLNNLKIRKPGEKDRHLTPEQKDIIYQLAYKYKEVKYTQIRKALNLGDLEKFKGLTYPYKYAQGKDKKIKNPEDSVFIEHKTYHLFKSALKSKEGQEFLNLLLNDYDLWNDIVEILWLSFEDNEAKNKLAEKLQNLVSEEVINELIQIKSIDDTTNLSIKAIKQILPLIKQGKFYSEAVEEAIPEEFRKGVAGTRQTFLPEIEDLKYITNRVVRKSLAQARKLINAIIRTYGSPTFVNIELARDATKSLKEKLRDKRQQEENQKNNKEIIEKLKTEFHIASPSREDIVKYKLWCDQDGKCGYSAEPIDAHILFTNETQIDHILPWSRTFDDSYSNKILVLARENQQKGDRTPYEYFGETERWNKMLDYWYAWYANKNQDRKYNNLTIKDFNEREQEFQERNINDTRYISRFLKNYIEDNLAFASTTTENKQRVFVFNGTFTSTVRRSFNFQKSREENLRHHALDAVVVGIGNIAMNLKVQKYEIQRREFERIHKDKNLKLKEIDLPEPWPRFAEDVYVRIFEDNPKEKLQELGILEDYGELEKYIRPLIVSRAPKRKARGQLHEETIRNIKEIINEKGEKEYYFVSKISIEKLTKKHFEENKIYGNDPKLVEVLRKRLEEYNWDASKAFKEPIYKPCKPGKNPNRILKVKVLTDPANSYVQIPNRGYAQKSTIVRTDVFRMNGKTYLVPVYIDQIYSGKLPNKAIVQGKSEEEWIDVSKAEFLFSLYPNDYVKLFKNKEHLDSNQKLITEGYYCTVVRSVGNLGIIAHDYIKNTPPSTGGYFGVQNAQIEKYYVDILGNIYKIKKEKRQIPKIKKQ